MSISARMNGSGIFASSTDCAGCGGNKGAPIAGVVSISRCEGDVGLSIALCEECGRDLANAVGFMCIRDGGWSKLEPRKSKGTKKLSTKDKVP